MSGAPANHEDVDEDGPQRLESVNAASATSSHGQVPQTGWSSVQGVHHMDHVEGAHEEVLVRRKQVRAL